MLVGREGLRVQCILRSAHAAQAGEHHRERHAGAPPTAREAVDERDPGPAETSGAGFVKPGIYQNVPEAEYRAWPLPSQSVLKKGAASMAHLKAAIDAGESEPTDAKRVGSALHVAFLEPERASERVVRWDGGTRRGEKWDDFCAEHDGKIILTPAQHEQVTGMIRSLSRHPFVKQWARKVEGIEVSAVGEFAGVTCKGRCDALTPDPLVDLKKVRSGDLRTFSGDVVRYGYHQQAAMYRRLFNRDRFVLVTVEDKPPFDVVPYELSPALIREGDAQLQAICHEYRRCVEAGVWPGRSNEVVQIECPEWMASDAGIVFDEE